MTTTPAPIDTPAGHVDFTTEDDGTLYANLYHPNGELLAAAAARIDNGTWELSPFTTADDTAAPLDNPQQDQARQSVLTHLQTTTNN